MKYDVIVVGAGSAGATLAMRLSEDTERSILLLEAGPDYPEFERLPDDIKYGWGTGADLAVGGDHDWKFVGKSTDTGEPMAVPRGKVTGGTSAINGQVFLRAIPEDLESWVALGNDQWSYESLLPYHRKIENDLDISDDFHGNEGPIPVRRHKRDDLLPDQVAFYDACLAAGFADNFDHNHPDATGVGPYPLNNPDGIRFSTALGYLDQARHRLNLTLRPSSTAHRILFDGNRATGVQVESGGEMFDVEADHIVLSAGPIGSPHLLLLSGIGPADHLKSFGIPIVVDSPGVGQNLRDHPTVHVLWKVKEGFPMPSETVGPQKVALRYTAQGSHFRNDMIKVMRFRSDERLAMMSVGIYLAMSAGELKLTSTDLNVQPSLDYRYLQDPFDIQRMRDGVKLSLSLAERVEFNEIIDELVEPDAASLESDDALDEWMKRRVSTMHHISCTCKMGPDSDEMAVVDQYGNVRGVEGLRVADISIMPDCVRANTNVIAMVIGERIADFIKQGR